MPFWPFKRSHLVSEAQILLLRVAEASRQPEFFGPRRIADTLEGRFELMTLHAGLALIRLGQAPEAARLAQAFADALFRHFDAGLREAGVGDLSVPKRMRKMAGDFYGRLEAYSTALKQDDAAALAAAIGRNIAPAPGGEEFAAALAGYARRLAALQAGGDIAALLTPRGWAASLP